MGQVILMMALEGNNLTLDVGAIAAWAAALTTIGSLLWVLIRYVVKPLKGFMKAFEAECKRNKYQDRQIAESMEQRKLMYITLLAVLEGLLEMGCNNNVTKQHTALKAYLQERPFDCTWYKEDNKND